MVSGFVRVGFVFVQGRFVCFCGDTLIHGTGDNILQGNPYVGGGMFSCDFDSEVDLIPSKCGRKGSEGSPI